MASRTERKEIGRRRLVNILERQTVALGRTLEQKIADAGPYNQRIDPHILTECRRELIDEGRIVRLQDGDTPWFHLNDASPDNVEKRLGDLKPIHAAIRTQNFTMRVGQALEIAVYRALAGQSTLDFLGNYPDLDAHDDSELYTKEEPPSSISGRAILTNQKAFIIETIQEIRRLADERSSHINLFIDELRFLVSKPVADALATIRQFDATITTAYQNFSDLRNPDDSKLDGRAIEQAVKANSQIKLIFGGTDPDTAEFIAATSGSLFKKVARYEATEINPVGGEAWGRTRMMSDLEEPVIPENTVLALPHRVAVLLQPGRLAKVLSVAPVPLEVLSGLLRFAPNPHRAPASSGAHVGR